MSVRVIDILSEAGWAQLACHRHASLFSSTPWITALSRTYGFDCKAVILERNRLIEAALPFTRIADIRGERVICLPFSDYCDPLVSEPPDWQALVAPLFDFGVPVALRCLRNSLPAQDYRFTLTGKALWHSVDLQRSEETIWSELRGSARQNVRKACRLGVTVREGRTLEDVQAFHEMHCHVRKVKYRLLAQPLAFFECLHAAFTPEELIAVLLAEVDGRPIAGILLLEWGNTLYYKFNASTDPTLRPNDLLLWESLRLGRRRGLQRLDFGLSNPEQPGLVRYKRKFATEERTIDLLRFHPDHYLDSQGEAVSRVLASVTKLFTESTVPDQVTRAAGDALYRYFC